MSTDFSLILGLSSPSAEGQGGGLLLFLPYVLIFLVFYFLLIAPARRKQKAHQEMITSLTQGAKVITNGGIHGTVVGVSESLIQLRIADKVKIDVSRSAIAALQEPGES